MHGELVTAIVIANVAASLCRPKAASVTQAADSATVAAYAATWGHLWQLMQPPANHMHLGAASA